MKIISMNTENNNTNEPYEFVLHLSQKLDLRSSNKYVAIQPIYLLHVEKYNKTVLEQ